jgi:hypothetical protein
MHHVVELLALQGVKSVNVCFSEFDFEKLEITGPLDLLWNGLSNKGRQKDLAGCKRSSDFVA